MTAIASLRSTVLDLPPSCIEFCPSAPQYAVIGTYNLEKQDEQKDQDTEADQGQKTSQQRNGSLILIEVIGDDVTILQTLPTPSAILDVHFRGQSTDGIFGAATSTGAIGIYKLTVSNGEAPVITHVHTLQFFAEDELITAFSWHSDGRTLGMTLSTGWVYLGEEINGEEDTAEVLIHELEVWTLAFIPDGSGILSGGDDCALRFEQLPRKSAWVDKKIHGAGVTAILPVFWDESEMLVVTGSYDDHIRLIHVPTTGRREVLTEMNLEGGVWRLKILDQKPAMQKGSDRGSWVCASDPEELLLLVSCMHAGTRIVRLFHDSDKAKWHFEVKARFEEHKSMNYGSDCQPHVDDQGQRKFITTSFYDRLLCLWRY
ncbi:WD-40 repeat-containing protein-like protein [Setomelanomma holmii]|uniref:methylated diphthine methylhydrolase n=1 Tax=Setomelanomma holmii TaxID=210430 RepID=A0A9P4H697_9PLEO|nr:WD-40 repeat-containing protein-like protein [Setomelanomma holmii]